jgi:N-acetylglutamate synthase-like GNAT family acetyltransferase
MTEIREATEGDVVAILRIDERASGSDTQRVDALTEAVRAGHVLVHTTEGEVDGYAHIKPRHFFGRDFVNLLSVSNAHRRVGIGSGLMAAALGCAGTGQLFTSTNQSNLPMRRLLERDEWEFSGELDGLDAGDPERVYFKRRKP